jgi:hypothetical protein
MPNQATPSCAKAAPEAIGVWPSYAVIDLRDHFLLESSP